MAAGVHLVTGAARGIGFACAEALASEGARLLVCDLDRESVERAAGALRDANATVEALAADITRDADLRGIAARIEALGGLAGCVHAAGLGGTMADAARVIEVNLAGTARLLDALLPVANAGSAVVCIASQAAHFWAAGASPGVRELLADATAQGLAGRLAEALGMEALDGGTAYGLSKYGVLQLVVERAAEFGARGVRLLSISPGIIETPMAAAEMAAHTEAMRAIIDMTPVGGRMGAPAELGAVAAFLCSPRASFVSGVDLLVDGGSTGQVLRGR